MWRDKELQGLGMVGHSGLYEYVVTFYSPKKGKVYQTFFGNNKESALDQSRDKLKTMRGFTILTVDEV